MWIDYGVTRKTPRMNASQASTRVGIVDFPRITADVLFQDEDMTSTDRNHSRSRSCPREFEPIGRKPKVTTYLTKDTQRRTATAKGPSGATCRMGYNLRTDAIAGNFMGVG